jgi:DNA-binding MltR family transcriptional regulator
MLFSCDYSIPVEYTGSPMKERTDVKLEPPPRLPLEDKLTADESAAFFEQSSDRAMAIIWAAIVENHLTSLLRMLMRRENEAVSIANELFKPTGPLGAFGTKIKLAYMLRIIEPDWYNDYIIISRIRNAFAHDLSKTGFDDQQITAWIKNMHMYAIVQKMGDDASERLSSKETRREGIKGTADFIASGFNDSMRDSYRHSLRFIIESLTDFENSIVAAEKKMKESQPQASPETH